MADYKVQYVPDEVLEGRDFIMCNKHADGVRLYLRRSVRDLSDEENAAVWECAWAAFRQLAQVSKLPQQQCPELWVS